MWKVNGFSFAAEMSLTWRISPPVSVLARSGGPHEDRSTGTQHSSTPTLSVLSQTHTDTHTRDPAQPGSKSG